MRPRRAKVGQVGPKRGVPGARDGLKMAPRDAQEQPRRDQRGTKGAQREPKKPKRDGGGLRGSTIEKVGVSKSTNKH